MLTMPQIPSPTAKNPLRGLYPITPETMDTEWLCQAVTQVLQGGACLIQYRNKSNDKDLRYMQASRINALCRAWDVPLIINDDVELCEAIDAAGVHLGRSDGTLATARAHLGAKKLIGISCYNDIGRAQAAVLEGADYIALGSFYVSRTKPGAVPCGLDVLRAARNLGRPVVAIGGITVENGDSLVQAGADLLAVISDVFDARDIAARTAQYQTFFNSIRSQLGKNQP